MTVLEYALLALSSLFVIVDPIAVVPSFLAMTPDATPVERTRTARLACIVMVIVLMSFAMLGTRVLEFLGITLPAFQIAGSIVLLLIALDMLRAQRSRVQETREETAAGAAKEDIAITPLAIPMLAGPGAISTVILLHNRAIGFTQNLALLGVIALIGVIAYIILHLSAHGARWLNPIAMRITTRIMGLLLAAVAIQFMANALGEMFHWSSIAK
ncbi:MAG TPA: MarC family protein [Candidatus Acidoferrum sp.]|nr:MarC family protein [Candidatus Acidoferrum sp.]